MVGRDREVASLVRRAKAELRGGHRREALQLLQKALAIDPESNAVTEAILQIERESAAARRKEAEPSPKPEKKSGAKKSPSRKKRKATEDKSTKASRSSKPREETAAGKKPSPPEKKAKPKPGRRRSRRLRAVPEAREEKPAPAKKEKAPAGEEPAESAETTEKEGPMASTEQLQALLDTTAEAMRSGDDSRAVKALKQARAMAPEDERVLELTERYRSSRKARKAIALSRKGLADGSPRKATAYARKAFQLDPDAPGLDELLEEIESSTGGKRAPKKTSKTPTQSGGEADTYVQKIREKIQISSFPEAAKLTKEAIARYPDNELLRTFDEKFKKMGLID
ncbi:MAG: hypothetical protein R6U36_01560 [Candidatus Fermentibacteraceae bacterium]